MSYFALAALGWQEARRILRGTSAHDAACRHAGLECLLDFVDQFHAGRLNRRAALDFLTAF